MRLVEPIDILFLFLRGMGMFQGLTSLLALPGLVSVWLTGPQRIGMDPAYFVPELVGGVLNVTVGGILFLFPDRIATWMLRKTPLNLTRVAFILVGMILVLESLRSFFDAWGFAKLLTNDVLFGVIPYHSTVLAPLYKFIAGALVILSSGHLSNWIDPDWRQIWARNHFSVDHED